MRYTRNKESEKQFLNTGKFMSGWEVKEKEHQKKLKKKARKKKQISYKKIRAEKKASK